jgi:putative transcriptional regulator
MRNRLIQLRSDRGLTKTGLAEKLGVSRQTVISIEQGRYDPSMTLLFAIADLFDITHVAELKEILDADHTPDGETTAAADR